MAVNSRRTAAFIVARWLMTKDFPANLLPEGQDRAFVQDLVYTVIRRLRPLRRILGGFLKTWPKGELEALLYVGAAQILYMPEVPDFAAVNETVNAAKACENKAIAKVVNGVLRNLLRQRDVPRCVSPAASHDITPAGETHRGTGLGSAAAEAARGTGLGSAAGETHRGTGEMLSILLGTELETFPTAIAKRWTARFGAENAEKLAAHHNRPAETYLARKDGSFVTLERGVKVSDVPGYATGDFIVQDPGTKLAIELLDPKPGETVLDACAAPGGKTVQIAWRGAAVTACEINPKRRARLVENLKRLGLGESVSVVESIDEVKVKGEGERRHDVSVVSASQQKSKTIHSSPSPLAFTFFTKVLVDAPCSNTGVFRRRPDARWNWSVEKLAELVKLQAEILDRCAQLVTPGGTLVYSTCSNEPEENLDQVNAFLARHPDFTLAVSRESIPYESGHDGAFAAALIRLPGDKIH